LKGPSSMSGQTAPTKPTSVGPTVRAALNRLGVRTGYDHAWP
jgi:hypothetical protein